MVRALRIEHSCRAYNNRNRWPSISRSQRMSLYRRLWRSAGGRIGQARRALLGAAGANFMRSPQVQEEATLRRFEK